MWAARKVIFSAAGQSEVRKVCARYRRKQACMPDNFTAYALGRTDATPWNGSLWVPSEQRLAQVACVSFDRLFFGSRPDSLLY
eukprot:6193024-Pleurochrysis_carterae.AAC.1